MLAATASPNRGAKKRIFAFEKDIDVHEKPEVVAVLRYSPPHSIFDTFYSILF